MVSGASSHERVGYGFTRIRGSRARGADFQIREDSRTRTAMEATERFLIVGRLDSGNRATSGRICKYVSD